MVRIKGSLKTRSGTQYVHNKQQPLISKEGSLSICEAVLGQSLGSSSSLARGTLSYWLCPISRQMSSNTSQPLPLSPCPLPTHLLFLCSPFPQVSKRVFCSPCFHFFLSPAFPNPLSLDSSLSLPFLCSLTASLPICPDLSAGAPSSGDPPSLLLLPSHPVLLLSPLQAPPPA